MGRDKAWLELGGRPLLVHVVSILAERCRPIVIVAQPRQELPQITREGVERVDDPPAQGPDVGGPLVGVVAGLERLAERGAERAYLGSCDAVALSISHVAFMLDTLAQAPELVGLVPRDLDGRVHPLASAVVVDAMLARAKAQLSRGDLRLQALFRGPQLRSIPAAQLPDPEVLAPCNTPEQWRALTRRLQRRRG
jgi:molybdopterin-guanine dinucleotide biosynthesis protein A